jgi:hypothetical protein
MGARIIVKFIRVWQERRRAKLEAEKAKARES